MGWYVRAATVARMDNDTTPKPTDHGKEPRDPTVYVAKVENFSPSTAREAVLSNLRARAYDRVEDIHTDIADLESREPVE